MEQFLTLPNIIGVIVAVTLAVIAIRLVVKFDINQWLERRDRLHRERIRMTCTHTLLRYDSEKDEMTIKSFFIKPVMTATWVCQACGKRSDSNMEAHSSVEYWKQHPMERNEQNKKFMKLVDKNRRC